MSPNKLTLNPLVIRLKLWPVLVMRMICGLTLLEFLVGQFWHKNTLSCSSWWKTWIFSNVNIASITRLEEDHPSPIICHRFGLLSIMIGVLACSEHTVTPDPHFISRIHYFHCLRCCCGLIIVTSPFVPRVQDGSSEFYLCFLFLSGDGAWVWSFLAKRDDSLLLSWVWSVKMIL